LNVVNSVPVPELCKYPNLNKYSQISVFLYERVLSEMNESFELK